MTIAETPIRTDLCMLSVCRSVCMHACMHACMHIYIYIYINVYVCIYVGTCVRTCGSTYVRTYVRTYVLTHACMHVFMCMYADKTTKYVHALYLYVYTERAWQLHEHGPLQGVFGKIDSSTWPGTSESVSYTVFGAAAETSDMRYLHVHKAHGDKGQAILQQYLS